VRSVPAKRRWQTVAVVAAAVCVFTSCGVGVQRVGGCGPTPARQPAHTVVPDRYLRVVGPKVARFWLTGDSQQRPTALDLAGGVVVVVDARTRLLGRCGHPCFTYVALRAHSQIADALYPTLTRQPHSAELLADTVWHVGEGSVEMSSGLSLKLAPGTTVKLNDSELRTVGNWLNVTVDDRGAVTKIEQVAFGCG
jgi:hypothetical protein